VDSDELANMRRLLAAMSEQINALVAAQKPAVEKSLPVGELYDHEQKKREKLPAWWSRRAMLLPFVQRYRERDAASLTQVEWAEYREARSDLSPASRNVSLRYVKAMLNGAVRDGRLSKAPLICQSKEEPQKENRQTAPTEAAIQLLLSECQKLRETVMVLCACDSGMRRNELRQLEWSWIDRERMEIALPDWACKNRGGGVLPMTARTLAAIDAMPRVISDGRVSPYVIAKPDGGGMYVAQMFTNWFRELEKKAQLKAAPGDVRVHLHDLRASFLTNGSERGVRLEVLQRIARHKSIEQTIKYTRRRPPDLERARELFEAGIERDKRR
jgi:integrase